MKLGIDIDDTIVETSKGMRTYLKELFPEMSVKIREVLLYELLHGNYYKNFWLPDLNRMIFAPLIEDLEVKTGAIEVINHLGREHEIYLVTARNNILGEDVARTIDYLSKIKLDYKELHHTAFDKGKISKKLELDCLIDDNLEQVLKANSVGTRGILFQSSVNNQKSYSDVVSDWKSVPKMLGLKYGKNTKKNCK